MKNKLEDLDNGQLDAMWNFLRMGYQKPNIPLLKENCNQLRQVMIQKDGGQRRDSGKNSVSFEDIGTLRNCIVIETMCLYLSGGLDKLETLLKDGT